MQCTFAQAPAGRRWIGLMAEWDTDLYLTAGPGGAITFEGFYGDYEVVAGDQTYTFTHEKDREGPVQASVRAEAATLRR